MRTGRGGELHFKAPAFYFGAKVLQSGDARNRETGMWRSVVVFILVVTSAAEAGEVRSSFQVGLTITGRATSVPIPTSAGRASVPLPRPRPMNSTLVTTSGISSSR